MEFRSQAGLCPSVAKINEPSSNSDRTARRV
jgi:hypothetical protein